MAVSPDHLGVLLEAGELDERDGRVRAGDGGDVGVDGGGVHAAGGEKDGDGEGGAVVAEDELPELDHRDHVADPRSWVQDYRIGIHLRALLKDTERKELQDSS